MVAVPARIERTRSLLQISRVAVQFGLGAATKTTQRCQRTGGTCPHDTGNEASSTSSSSTKG